MLFEVSPPFLTAPPDDAEVHAVEKAFRVKGSFRGGIRVRRVKEIPKLRNGNVTKLNKFIIKMY